MTEIAPEFEVFPSGVDLALLRRELELERRLLALQKNNAIFYFSPHEKQELFFAAANYHYRYARTGNRFGKSEMGAAEDVAFALGYRPWIAEGNPLRTLGIPSFPTKGLIVCVSWKKSREVFTEIEQGNLGKLFRYIPKDCLLDYSKNHSGFIDRFVVKHISGGRSVIMLATVEGFKNNPLDQESSVHDWVHVDEPIPNAMWKAIVRGLTDRKGRAWFTCTPLSEPWIDAEFVPNLEDQSRENVGVIASEENSRWMMTGTMDDNPHNTADSIALTLSWYTDDEKEARRKGVPIAYAGIIYKEFDMNLHVLRAVPKRWRSWDLPPPEYTVRIAHDYHFRKNDAILFIATSPQEIHYVFAELWIAGDVDEITSAIKGVLQGRDYQPIRMDPLASIEMKVSEMTVMDEYRRRGLAVLPATKDPVNGIRAVKAMLKARTKEGTPVLFFNPALRRTLFEISRGFQWDDDQNKPIKKDDDMMENLYRLVLEGLPYIPPSTEDEYIPFRFSMDVDDFTSIPSFAGLDNPAPPKKKTMEFSRYRN